MNKFNAVASQRLIYSKVLTWDFVKHSYGTNTAICINRHCHTALELIYVIDGEMNVEYGEEKKLAHKGELLIFNPFEMHYGYLDREHPFVQYAFLVLELSSLQHAIIADNRGIVAEIIAQRRFFCPGFADPTLTAEPERLILECTRHYADSLENPAASYRLLGSAAAMLGQLLEMGCFRESTERDIKRRRFASQINAYIEDNYRREILSDELPKLFSCTQVHFCRTFKQCFGTTFSHYLREYRINQALKLMNGVKDDKNLTAIALEVGFSDHSYFSRVFRRTLGILPSEYMRRIREYTSEMFDTSAGR